MPAEALLTRGRTANQAIGASGTFDLPGSNGAFPAKVDCVGDSTLTVSADMTGAIVGDLTVAVNPYGADGITPQPVALPLMYTSTPIFATGKVYVTNHYDVTGVDAVRIRLGNTNVGAQTLNASWKLA